MPFSLRRRNSLIQALEKSWLVFMPEGSVPM